MLYKKIINYCFLIIIIFLIFDCSEKKFIEPAPIADFVFSIEPNGNVTFVNTSTNGETYIWNFGDNSSLSNEFSPIHKFDKNGDYKVKLQVAGKGGTNEKIIIVTIQLPTPKPDFTYIVNSNGNVAFTNISTNSDTYKWNFGDGSPIVSDYSPSHLYTKNGNYNVKLEATGKGGINEIVKIITLQIPLPISNFLLSSQSYLAPSVINLTNLSQYASQFEWYLNGVKKAESSNTSFNLPSGKHILELRSIGFGTSIKKDTIFIFEPSIYENYGSLKVVQNNLFFSKAALKNPKFPEVILYVNNRLEDMEAKLPSKFLQFSHNIKVWFENEERLPFLAAHYMPKDYAVANNVFPPKQNSVIIPHLTISLYDTGLFNQPEILIHEFAHAYHDMVLGFNYQPIINAYDNAMASGKYQNVKHTKYADGKAYATTNHKEYFAELNEAYFGTNDFYPFNRADLKLYDPIGFNLIEAIWK